MGHRKNLGNLEEIILADNKNINLPSLNIVFLNTAKKTIFYTFIFYNTARDKYTFGVLRGHNECQICS